MCLIIASSLIVNLQTLPVEKSVLKNGPNQYGTSVFGLGLQALTTLEGKLAKIGKGFSCEFCKVATGLVQSYLELETTEEEIVKLLTQFCIKFKIEDVNVCTGIIPEFKDEVLSVLNEAIVTPDDICGTILGPTCADAGTAFGPWNVTLPKKVTSQDAEKQRADLIRERKVYLQDIK